MGGIERMDDERRRYFRIDDKVGLSLKPLSAGQEEEAIAQFQNASTHNALFNDLRAVRTQHLPQRRQLEQRNQAFMAYVGVLERQIELLALALDARWDGPQLPDTEVNLSAQGLSVSTEQTMQPGALVEVRLMLFPEHSRIFTLGRVTSIEAEAEHGHQEVGIDFTHLREADREAIARHVHTLQLERLRAEKGYTD